MNGLMLRYPLLINARATACVRTDLDAGRHPLSEQSNSNCHSRYCATAGHPNPPHGVVSVKVAGRALTAPGKNIAFDCQIGAYSLNPQMVQPVLLPLTGLLLGMYQLRYGSIDTGT
jgi:hypothetical protein